jgi:sortase (surface protein transpeptidase)
MLAPSQASTLTARGDSFSSQRSPPPLCWTDAFQVLEPDPEHPDNVYAPAKPGAVPHAVWRLCVPTAVMRGSKLMFGSSSWNLGQPLRALIAVGLAIIGAVVVWAALARPSSPEPALAPAPNDQSMPSTSRSVPQPTPERPTARADQTDLRDRTTGLVLPESNPVAVSIPSIDVQSRLVNLGLKTDGAMEVPEDPADAGWFSRGPTPGALGPAVIAGHVTWNGVPGIFHRLGTLRRGDQVTVTRKDGKTAVFTVTRVAQFSKSRFPSRAVYGAIDHAGLRLITCGGTYDAGRHTYLDNVIVFAKLEAVRGPRG